MDLDPLPPRRKRKSDLEFKYLQADPSTKLAVSTIESTDGCASEFYECMSNKYVLIYE